MATRRRSRDREAGSAAVSASEYRALGALRYELRKFLAFSERAARAAGVEPQQHQLLLAVQGLPLGVDPAIGAVAERLCVQPHTAVALVDKLEARGLIARERSTRDRRVVWLRLTAPGSALLRRLSALHRQQLKRNGPAMVAALRAILERRDAPEAEAEAEAEAGELG
jgi:DNA-binding MarR family transcriptional regulator